MASCIVHLDAWRGKAGVARGMSWSARSSDIAAAFASRPEPEIWLKVGKFDEVKKWASRQHDESAPLELLYCQYSGTWVEWQVDQRGKGSGPRPAWFGMDDPPLLFSIVYSLPAPVMRTAGLTKDRTAQVFADLVATALRDFSPITARDWHLSVWLDAPAKQLITRLSDRLKRGVPTNTIQEWRIQIDLDDDHAMQP